MNVSRLAEQKLGSFRLIYRNKENKTKTKKNKEWGKNEEVLSKYSSLGKMIRICEQKITMIRKNKN